MSSIEQQPSRQRMWPPGAETDSVSFGTWLRRQREIREISLREIADVTKISIRYLEALEQDRFDVLPAPVFAKGFLREYARYVGLDPDEVVNSYLNAQEEIDPGEEAETRVSPRRGGRLEKTSGLLLAAAVMILLAIVAALAFYMERSQTETTLEPPPIAAPPIQASPPVPEPRPAVESSVPLLVTIDFTGECWIEATVDDAERISELHVPGESLQIEAQQRVVLTLGDPNAAIIEVNGKPFSVSAPPGSVARDIEIDLSSLGSGSAPGVLAPGSIPAEAPAGDGTAADPGAERPAQ